MVTEAKGNQVKYRINIKNPGKALFRERVISSKGFSGIEDADKDLSQFSTQTTET